MGQSLLCSSMIYGFHGEEAPICDLCVMAHFLWYIVNDISIEPAASIFRVELVVWFRGCELTRLYSVGESWMVVYGRLSKILTVECRKYWERLSQYHFSKTNSTQIDLRTNPSFRGEETGSNRLWYGTYINTDDWKTNLLCGTYAVPKPGNYRNLIKIKYIWPNVIWSWQWEPDSQFACKHAPFANRNMKHTR